MKHEVYEHTGARWRLSLVGWTARSYHPEDPSSGRQVQHKIEIGCDSLADVPATCTKLIAKVRKIQR